MSSDYDSIQEVGGEELARHYPDRGVLAQSPYYKAVLSVEAKAEGFLDQLWDLGRGNNAFLAVLSADADGLRIVVSLYDFTVFLPWSEVTVWAERKWPATVARLQTAAVPSLSLELHLDDPAADDLFRGVIPPLPERVPPRRLLWVKPWEVVVLVVVTLASCGLFIALQLSWVWLLPAVVAVAVVLCLVLTLLRPYLEEGSS